jgi:hypothetical protein
MAKQKGKTYSVPILNMKITCNFFFIPICNFKQGNIGKIKMTTS